MLHRCAARHSSAMSDEGADFVVSLFTRCWFGAEPDVSHVVTVDRKVRVTEPRLFGVHGVRRRALRDGVVLVRRGAVRLRVATSGQGHPAPVLRRRAGTR